MFLKPSSVLESQPCFILVYFLEIRYYLINNHEQQAPSLETHDLNGWQVCRLEFRGRCVVRWPFAFSVTRAVCGYGGGDVLVLPSGVI